GLANLSAKAIGRIINQNHKITTLELCMNSLHLGLDYLVAALKKNTSIVCLKLRNNSIDGRKFKEELY
ncbi:MAG: hypothetical protein ACK55Z_17845, partial [bacterium]